MVTISKFSYQNPRYLNLLMRRGSIPQEVETTVRDVLKNVKEKGDEALYSYMKKFDGVDIREIGLLVSEDEFANAREKVSEELKEAVKKACDNLFKFHKRQLPKGFIDEYEDGTVLERKYTPINSVAVTVPGNMAPLVSTLYMNLIPAIVAGVPDIYILTKPRMDGTIDEHLLYVADYLNVKNYYKLSGSQGLAAVAYGTGFEASTTFCLSETQAQQIKKEINRLCEENDLIEKTRRTFENYGDIFIVDSIQEAVEAVNEIAPEHVELLLADYETVLPKLTNAGAVFVGEYSTEPVGDYFCGTNHILPTCGTAKFSSGMSVGEFVRGYSVIKYAEPALKSNAEYIIQLAESEGMKAHALAVKVRR